MNKNIGCGAPIGAAPQDTSACTRRAAVLRGTALAAGLMGGFALRAQPVGGEDEILIGQSCQLSGPLAPMSEELRAGADWYIGQVNAQGGVNGRRIRILALDDAYDPRRAADNVRRLIERDKVFALFNLAGTPPVLAALPFAIENKVPVLAPFTGSDALRDSFQRYVFNVRAGYRDEIGKIVQHLGTLGMNRLGVAYLNNAFGKDGLAIAEAAAAKRGVSLVASAPLEVDGRGLQDAVRAIAAQRPHAIVLVSAGRITSDFIGAYRDVAAGAQFYALSVVSSRQLMHELGERSRGVIIAQVMPSPWSDATPAGRELAVLARRQGVAELSANHMEGYLSAKVLVEGLRRMGRNLDREAFVRALESLREFDLGGYRLSFSERNHNGSGYVELSAVGAAQRMMR